jgi:hypothetical protein
MEHHGEAMRGQLDVMQKSLLHTMKVNVGQINYWTAQQTAMQGQLDAIKEQAALMRESIAQNERAVGAAEESAKTAQEALDIEEAPYFGIVNCAHQGIVVGQRPKFEITFMNGGRTPAWNFYAIAQVFVGHSPELTAEKFSIQPELGNWGDTFVPPGKEKTICLSKTDFQLTEEQDKAMRTYPPQRLFIQGTAHYRNSKGKQLWTEFCGVYYPSTDKFGDYYAT